MPSITSNDAWKQLTQTLWTTTEKFARHVENMTEDQLESGFVKEEYGSYRRNIEAMIEHAYYHLGQISLIKKMISE